MLRKILAGVAAALCLSTSAFAEILATSPAASGGGSDCTTTCTYTGVANFTLSANGGAINVTGYSLTGSDASKAVSVAGTWNTTGAAAAFYANMTATACGNAAFLSMNQSVSGEVFRVSCTGNITVGPASALTWSGRGSLRTSADGAFQFANNATNFACTLTLLADNQLKLCGGVVNRIRVVTAAGAVTVDATDYIVSVNKTSGAATTVNLPACASGNAGATYVIVDGKGDAATNNITLDGNASETINGSTTYVMSTNYQSATVACNGSAATWSLI